MQNSQKGKNNPMYGVHRFGKDAPFYGRHHSQATRRILRLANLGRHFSQQHCTRMSEALCGRISPMKGRHPSKSARKKMSAAAITRWQDPEFRNKQVKALMKSWHKRPNELEVLAGTLLHDLYPRKFSYNGNGPIIVGGKVPDFIHNNGRKLVINVNGDYFHKEENVHDVKRHYAKHGYSLLVIWQSEIDSDWAKVTRKIRTFVG
jgi:hypothetical protein